MRELLEELLKSEENCNLKRHKVEGKDHIGWGFSLGHAWDQIFLDRLGVSDEDEIQEISQADADWMFDELVSRTIAQTESMYPNSWENLSEVRRVVLCSMMYQLGLGGMQEFVKMNRAIRASDWSEAADQMLDSEVARSQAPNRFKRQSAAFRMDNAEYLELPQANVAVPVVKPDLPTGESSDLENYSTRALLIELIDRMLYLTQKPESD